MPADEIGEVFFRVVLRGVGYVLVEVLWEIVCYYVGLPVIKLVTLGKYPDNNPTVVQESITSIVGCLLLVLGLMWFLGFWS